MNKVIWIYWDKGFNNAPLLVSICVDSWIKRNPDWEVCLVDDTNINRYVDMNDIRLANPKLTIQAFADCFRWRLLSSYGGVWVDATLYCVHPLSSWLEFELARCPIFIFKTKENYLFNSWFIGVNSNSEILGGMYILLHDYLLRYGGFRHFWEIKFFWRFFKLLENSAGNLNYYIWRSIFFRKYIKASPYFFQNYLLGYLINKSEKAFNEYSNISFNYDNCPHAIQEFTLLKIISKDAINDILQSDCPVQKLTNKRFSDAWVDSRLLEILDRFNNE